MGYGAYVFVVIAAFVIFFAGLAQVLSYRRGQSLLTLPQLLLRLGTAAALLGVLGLTVWWVVMQAGWSLQGLSKEERNGLLAGAAGFWTLVMLLLVAAIVMALLDLRYVRAAQHRVRAAMYQNMAKLQAEIRAEAERRKAKGKEGDEN